MLYLFNALTYWEILISGVILFVVVPPSHRKFLSIIELATPMGRFLVVFSLGIGYTMCLNFSLFIYFCVGSSGMFS